jgi:hypothetical protein
MEVDKNSEMKNCMDCCNPGEKEVSPGWERRLGVPGRTQQEVHWSGTTELMEPL